MYIQPNTNVYLMHNVPFDEDYENTMDFSSQSQQFTYLVNNYLKYHLNRYSYQRAANNSIKVEKLADDLYDCNYMGFINAAYGNKVFYAFIKEVKYINDNVSELVYEIDPLQTWMFDYSLGQCFVEREHVADDAIGLNLVPEKLETGEYLSELAGVVDDIDDTHLSIVLFCTVDRSYNNTSGVFAGGVYSGLYPVSFPLTSQGAQSCIDWINQLPILKMDAIVSACIMPTVFANLTNIVEVVQDISKHTSVMRVDGTPVKNNKCLCYPYNYLEVVNNQGSTSQYRFEFFEEATPNKCSFSLWGDFTPNPSVLMYPKLYNGVTDNTQESITLSNFPQVAFNLDSFKAWLAQSASSLALTGVGTLASAILPNDTPLMQTAKYASVGGAVATAVQGVVAAQKPPQQKGIQQSSVQLVAGILNFTFYYKYLRPEYATIVDDYFSMFGYACHKVKVPDISSRISWNYVKTIGCVINGTMPADEMKRLKDIYNKGVRFWHYGKTIGDYTQNNNTVL